MDTRDAYRALLRDRGAHYGDFRDQACLAQALKETMHDTEGWVDKLNDAQREALDMIQHKVSRILNGDPNYKDSWTDIIGYAKLIEETLT